MRCLSTNPAERPSSAASAIDLLSPLRSARRRRIAYAGLTAACVLGAVAWWRTPWALRAGGLPDHQTRTDLAAAVRMFDAGDDAAALRVIERLHANAPQSAALVFWSATVHHSLGDASGRAAACRTEGALQGSAQWLRRAKAACDETYGVGASSSERAGELRPLWVQTALLPELEGDEDAQHKAREVLEQLEEDQDERLLPHRSLQARIDLELSLGRVEEAQQHLLDLVDAQPHVPLFAARLAWLASRRGQHDRALALALRVRAIDPTPSLALQMDAGQMRAAWTGIEALGEEHPHAEHLRGVWCGMAWRFGVGEPPPQCRDLPPGFARALWSDASHPLATLAADPCPEDPEASTVLAVAPWGFETTRTEAALRGALCRADEGDRAALGDAREQASRLLAATPDDPWARVLAADVAERSGDTPTADAHRVAAAQRWRDADPDLPLVSRVRQELDAAPQGPRTADAGAR